MQTNFFNRLNGWQRLFCVITTLWVILSVLIVYDSILNPYVSEYDIKPLLKPEHASVILDAGTFISGPSPKFPNDGDVYLYRGYQDYSDTGEYNAFYVGPIAEDYKLKISVKAVLEHVLKGIEGPWEAYELERLKGLEDDMAWAVATDFSKNLNLAVERKRAEQIKDFLIIVSMVPAFFYLLGWGIGWTIKGFRKTKA